MDFWLPIVFAFVLGASFVLLTLVFRSIVVAVTAIVLNLLSVGAAYGLLVLVFQHGVGADLLGFQTVDAVEAWVPLFLFSVLFGLSMDYHVFLLSRIRERYVATGDTDERRRARRRLDRAADHRRGADHHRRLHRLRDGRPRHVPADGLRRRGRARDRRDDRPHGAAAGRDEAARPTGTGTCRRGSSGCRTSVSRARPRLPRVHPRPWRSPEEKGAARRRPRSGYQR